MSARPSANVDWPRPRPSTSPPGSEGCASAASPRRQSLARSSSCARSIGWPSVGSSSHAPQWTASIRPRRRGRARPPADPRILDEQQLAALVRHSPDSYGAIVTLLAYSGLRISEALALRWADIDFVEGELHVRGQLTRATRKEPARIVPPKTNASLRTLPLFPAVEHALVERLKAEQRAGRGRDHDFVFCTGTGRPLSQRNVAARGITKAADSAGLGKVAPHDLRRSACSLAARRGVDPVEAARMTGHSLAVWAQHYARSFGKAQRDEARDRLLAFGFGADIALTQEPADEDATGEYAAESGDLQAVRRVERTGIEPVTSGLQSRRSPS